MPLEDKKKEEKTSTPLDDKDILLLKKYGLSAYAE